jgi:SAM-dependent methyltransferase
VSIKLIALPAALGLILAGLAPLLFVSGLPVLALPALLLLACAAYFAYARYQFSPQGGDVQTRIQGLLLERLDWDGQGRALDIGCGGGSLTLALAQGRPLAQVVGVDYWGGAWEFSQNQCQAQAQALGLGRRVTFQRASALTLPFADDSFDLVVSNLVFHEVAQAKDKREVVREALRVLRPGGRFVFQDLFLWQRLYGSPRELLDTLASWGLEGVELTPTRDQSFIPWGLKLPFMVGTLAILHGRK